MDCATDEEGSRFDVSCGEIRGLGEVVVTRRTRERGVVRAGRVLWPNQGRGILPTPDVLPGPKRLQ